MNMTAARSQVAALVHASVQPHSLERLRHERFMAGRLAFGAALLGLAPLYLAWRGGIGAFEAAILLAAILPVGSVALLSRTGNLAAAHLLSAAGFTLFVAALAALTGGAASPLLLWLAAIPAEALFMERRGYGERATLVAGVGVFLVVLLQGAGLVPPEPGWVEPATPFFAVLALLHAALLVAAYLARRDGETRAHRASDARAQHLLDHVGDLVTWHEPSGAVVYANAAARALVGAEPEALHGRGLFDRVHVADRPLFLKALSDAAHGVGEASACVRVLFIRSAAEGAPEVVWLDLRARRVGEAGSPRDCHVVCVMRDVTASRAIEEERERGRAEALKANDVKDQFLATVSHELRTPLNAIIGFSEMLALDESGMLDGGKRSEYARIIHSSGHHLLDVVNALLDVSKIESGAMTIEQEPVDLVELSGGCCDLMALRARSGEIALDRVLGAELPSLTGDRRALKQVLLNLLSNAIKFTPAGGKVTLALVRDGDVVDISVADTGIGIDAKDLPRLGDPFFQAKGSYDRAYEGTGLGLSVVRGLVGLHGGLMTVESAPGNGTRVSIRLPVGGVEAASKPVRIATFARAPRRGFDTKQPLRLTA